jgi:hypothetical protein
MGPAQNYVARLIQIIMFGMGTTLCMADFTRVLLHTQKHRSGDVTAIHYHASVRLGLRRERLDSHRKSPWASS